MLVEHETAKKLGKDLRKIRQEISRSIAQASVRVAVGEILYLATRASLA